MTGILITLERNLDWMRFIPKFETEVEQMQTNYQKPRWQRRRFGTIRIIGWKYNVTIKDGQFKEINPSLK